MRGSPTQLPVPVSRWFSFGTSSVRILRGAESTVTGSATTTSEGPVPVGVNDGLTEIESAIESQSQPTVTANFVLICEIQTNAVTETICPTLVIRGRNSSSEAPYFSFTSGA